LAGIATSLALTDRPELEQRHQIGIRRQRVTHPFDRQPLGALNVHHHDVDTLGAEYEADGRMRRWWTGDDLARFEAAAEPLVRQFSAYRPFPDVAVDGKLSSTENVADLGGLAAAFDAYRANFTPSVVLREPHSMIAVNALIADDAAEAERLMLPGSLSFLRMRQGGRPSRIPTLAEAEAYNWSAAETEWARERNSKQAIGDLGHVKQRLDDLVETTGADEIIVVPQGPNLETKLRTLSELRVAPRDVVL
jgi:hypothetical protein